MGINALFGTDKRFPQSVPEFLDGVSQEDAAVDINSTIVPSGASRSSTPSRNGDFALHGIAALTWNVLVAASIVLFRTVAVLSYLSVQIIAIVVSAVMLFAGLAAGVVAASGMIQFFASLFEFAGLL